MRRVCANAGAKVVVILLAIFSAGDLTGKERDCLCFFGVGRTLDSALLRGRRHTHEMAPAQLELFKFSLCKPSPPPSPPSLSSLRVSSHFSRFADVFLPVYAMLHYGDPEWYEKWIGPLRSDFRKDDTKQVRLVSLPEQGTPNN